jgi:hypothetical protein
MENTSFRGVSVITEQCKIRWTILTINVTIATAKTARIAESPRHFFPFEGMQMSDPDGEVMKILAMRAPTMKTVPERKIQ